MSKDELSQKSAQSILDSIRRIVRALRMSSRLAEKDLGISGAQLFVLQKLGDGSTLSINELADRTLTHQSSVSTVVGRLIERGLVLKNTSKKDARRLELSLSRKGRVVLRKAPSSAQEKLVSAIGNLSANQRTTLSYLLSAVVIKSGLANNPPQLFFEDEKDRDK